MKKKFGILIVMFIIIFALAIITNYADSANVGTGHEPKYCIKVISKDGGKVTYYGLGYKVIRYVGVSPNEPYESNIGVKFGNWFMKYELPVDIEDDNEEAFEIESLDDFYNTSLTKGNDIRNLSKQYNSFDAQKDNCFVIGAMVHNDYLYNEFMNKHNSNESVFIRVAQNTVEGDLILYDILYYEKTGKLYLVTDSTRDEFSSKEDRIIALKTFDNTSNYVYKENLYWVLYNGEELTDENFNSEDVFVLTTIN